MVAWLIFFAIVVLLLAFDLGVLHRRQRVISVSEALWLSLGYVILAMLFGLGVFYFRGPDAGYEFITGYLIEKSLSLDNLFVFMLIFSHFRVPALYQHRVLYWGVIGALVLRGILISAGVVVISLFHGILYIFGGFLVYTGIAMLFASDDTPDLEKNTILAFARRKLRVTPDYEGNRFFVRRENKLWVTPLLLVLVLIECSDLVFALDSVPAIFAVSNDPFIIYTSNIFAILGLRALYFALSAIMHRLEYLKYGLSLVLVLIGSKMLVNTWFETKVIHTEMALLATAGILGITTILSLLKTRNRKPEDVKPTGWVPGSPPLERDSTHSSSSHD